MAAALLLDVNAKSFGFDPRFRADATPRPAAAGHDLLATTCWPRPASHDLLALAHDPCFKATVRLSVVIPVFNELATLQEIVRRVRAVELPPPFVGKELLLVDDGSTDGTRDLLPQLEAAYDDVRVILHEKNQGKGAALRTGFRAATGDVVIVQDADLEYDPNEYPRLLIPIADGRADVVYGSRFIGGDSHRVLYFWHTVGNRVLTLLSNMMTDLNLTDMETCYKVFRREVIQSVLIEENRFGFEPEITAKLSKKGVRIYEVGISYSGRTYEEGKKIGWKDGVRALWCIAKYNLRG